MHNEDKGAFGIDVNQDGLVYGERGSQLNQIMSGTLLKMTIKGQTYIEAGDVIYFNIRSIDEKNPEGFADPQYSGRYIIAKLRHTVADGEYKMILECAKDSVFSPFASQGVKFFPAEASSDKAQLVNIYDTDRSVNPQRQAMASRDG